mmetsp:Transcript_13032/g.20498  ORF Transcript_13032/g.20498 Transcript_13032/m.20498 type:complete len:85 (+) Transcript_13032:231-485(+)
MKRKIQIRHGAREGRLSCNVGNDDDGRDIGWISYCHNNMVIACGSSPWRGGLVLVLVLFVVRCSLVLFVHKMGHRTIVIDPPVI